MSAPAIEAVRPDARAEAAAPEPVWYYIRNEWYKGRQPWFFDTSQLPGAKVLEENFEVVRDEILAFYEGSRERFQPNFTPYAYREEGWKTVNLFSYFLEYAKHTSALPKTTAIVKSIPGMCLAQIAVLEPRTRLKAHMGDCNALARMHLGIVVPGRYPELAMKVGREARCWEEGKVFAISIAHRHTAWNMSDRHRIVLIVDTILPEYHDRRYAIAGKALAVIAMKYCATRFPRLKKLPWPATRAIHETLGVAFRVRIWLQRTLGL